MKDRTIRATLVVDPPYQKNRIFDPGNRVLNRDDCLASIRWVRTLFSGSGVDLSTQDINHIDESSVVIYFEAPSCPPPRTDRNRSFLLAMEHPFIRPANDSAGIEKHYRKVFTWNDRRIDGEQFIKVNFTVPLPDQISMDLSSRKKMALVIAANKQLSHVDELYSKRINTIRWFEKNHPSDFDLYGYGWGDHCFTGWNRVFNRSTLLKHYWPRKPYSSWLGVINDKNSTMQSYRFSFCYENVKDSPGWITEKIFDAMFAGCVPVYRGADNVTDYVPESSFIDERQFGDLPELYRYLADMPDQEYLGYVESIRNFLSSPRIESFTPKYFGETVVREILQVTGLI